MTNNDIKKLFKRYKELENSECVPGQGVSVSGYGLDRSDIDYAAFERALLETFPELGFKHLSFYEATKLLEQHGVPVDDLTHADNVIEALDAAYELGQKSK